MKEIYVDEIPEYCYNCLCHNGENGQCKVTEDYTEGKRPFDCPLKNLQKLKEELEKKYEGPLKMACEAIVDGEWAIDRMFNKFSDRDLCVKDFIEYFKTKGGESDGQSTDNR